jgi:hypothetical protein
MSNLTMIDFQIFPSRYEQDGDGNKCCWLGGRNAADKAEVTLQPYKTDAISGNSNPEWGFHLLATGQPDECRLKYVKMSEPLKYWYGVSLNGAKLILKDSVEDTHFIVKKIGEYYTLEYGDKHAECENGNLGKSTNIDLWDITPPTTDQLKVYDDIPFVSFRILWKFVKMDHISGRDWITKLSAAGRNLDTLDRLFIPGTHDSGTEKNTVVNQTQFLTIAEQVAIGVRYFDLRVGDDWQLYHGANSGIYLREVVKTVVDHRNAHPGEFFFLQITPETPARFSSRLIHYLIANCSGLRGGDCNVFPHVYLPDTIPKLQDAAGKIFFFARYHPVPYNEPNYPFKEHEINWQDNTGGSDASPNPLAGAQVYVQDRYTNVLDPGKLNTYIIPTLKKKMFNKAPGWAINFTSVANKNPIDSAKAINPNVANLLMWTTPKPCGIMMIDDARAGNVANIIALNFD